MKSMSLIIIIATGALCLFIGILFGALPLHADDLTQKQNSLQQTLGIIGVGIVFVLIVVKQDAASWIAIIAMIAGVLVAKIPPLHHWLLTHFPIFEPKPKKHAPSSPAFSGNRTKTTQGTGKTSRRNNRSHRHSRRRSKRHHS